jgi:hypothetical protein
LNKTVPFGQFYLYEPSFTNLTDFSIKNFANHAVKLIPIWLDRELGRLRLKELLFLDSNIFFICYRLYRVLPNFVKYRVKAIEAFFVKIEESFFKEFHQTSAEAVLLGKVVTECDPIMTIANIDLSVLEVRFFLYRQDDYIIPFTRGFWIGSLSQCALEKYYFYYNGRTKDFSSMKKCRKEYLERFDTNSISTFYHFQHSYTYCYVIVNLHQNTEELVLLELNLSNLKIRRYTKLDISPNVKYLASRLGSIKSNSYLWSFIKTSQTKIGINLAAFSKEKISTNLIPVVCDEFLGYSTVSARLETDINRGSNTIEFNLKILCGPRTMFDKIVIKPIWYNRKSGAELFRALLPLDRSLSTKSDIIITSNNLNTEVKVESERSHPYFLYNAFVSTTNQPIRFAGLRRKLISSFRYENYLLMQYEDSILALYKCSVSSKSNDKGFKCRGIYVMEEQSFTEPLKIKEFMALERQKWDSHLFGNVQFTYTWIFIQAF